MTTVKLSRNVIGCRIGDEIFLHPELYKYPELHRAVLTHEKEHSSGYRLKDFLMDLSNEHMKGNKKAFYKFMFTHPRTLLGLLPIVKVGKYWTFDITMLGFGMLVALIIVMVVMGIR